MPKVDTIIIVGGGSSGWMSAALLVKAYPNKKITLIESPDAPIIGVGESTLGGINDYCLFLGIDEKDFMRHTDASYKMSIKFTDFYEKNYGSFHYPFGKPYFDQINTSLSDWHYKKALYPETPIEDYVKCYFPGSALYENNKFSENKYGQFDNFNPTLDVAYHFDAIKFGQWLKDKYCIPRGVQHIIDEVVDVKVNEDGIEKLVLKSGKEVISDLYLDCTGFKSLLLGEALNEPFTSYADMLPNNRAWATQLPYKNKEKELEPFTNSTAIGHGWVWNIPLWSRIGTGYVYSDKFISPEVALKEFKSHLCSEKMLIKREELEIEQLTFKDIKMRVGIHERTWVKNVVAIGLSAGFIEPLESNGLFTVHEFLFKLAKSLSRGTVTQWDRDVYNAATKGIFVNFAEFVALHYALSIRSDTPYWVANNNKVYCEDMVNQKPITSVGFFDLHDKKMFKYEHVGNPGINYISVGMNYMVFDQINLEISQNANKRNYLKELPPLFSNFERKKQRWNEAALNEKSLYQYLKDNIYS